MSARSFLTLPSILVLYPKYAISTIDAAGSSPAMTLFVNVETDVRGFIKPAFHARFTWLRVISDHKRGICDQLFEGFERLVGHEHICCLVQYAGGDVYRQHWQAAVGMFALDETQKIASYRSRCADLVSVPVSRVRVHSRADRESE